METKTIAETMTTFYIKNAFSLSGRQSIVFEGEIIDGTVKAGQKIKLRATDNHPLIELTISSVEYVDHIADKITKVGLMVRVEKTSDLNNLLNYKIQGEKCEIA